MTNFDAVPLFPLGIVVFPGSLYPLHIFEPRYRQLVQTSLADNSPFSIHLVHNGHIQPVGCLVSVHEVVKRHPSGHMDIVVKGLERFKLHTLDDQQPPLLYGSGESYNDDTEGIDFDLLEQCIEQHNEVIDVVFSNKDLHLTFPANDHIPFSFKIAQKSGLDNLDKQRLLDWQSENARLLFLHEFLEKMLVQLRERRRIESIIMNDGYLPGFR